MPCSSCAAIYPEIKVNSNDIAIDWNIYQLNKKMHLSMHMQWICNKHKYSNLDDTCILILNTHSIWNWIISPDTKNKTKIDYLLLEKCTTQIACHTKICYMKEWCRSNIHFVKTIANPYVLSTYMKNNIRIPNLILFFAEIVIWYYICCVVLIVQ